MKRLIIFLGLLLPFLVEAQIYQPALLFGKDENRTHSKISMGVPNDTFTVIVAKQAYPHIAFKGPSLYRWNVTDLRWDIFSLGASQAINENYKKDTVEMFRIDPTVVTTSNGWAGGAIYNSSTTESIVSEGIQIVNVSGTISITNSVRNTGWESCLNDIVAVSEFKPVSWVGTNSVIGPVLKGATNLFSSSDVLAHVNLSTMAVTLTNFTGVHSVGTLTTSISANNIVRISLRRTFDTYTIKVTNLSKGTDTETFVYDDNGGTGTSNLTNVYPGVIASNGTYILRNFVYYAHNYNPDLMMLGSSITQNQKLIADRDSTYTYRLQNNTSWKIECAAKSANSLEDMLDCLKEIRKIKPRRVLIEGGYNNNQTAGQPVSTWGPLYRQLVDSILNMGSRVIVQRIIPAANNTPTIVNTFVDTTWSNHPKVQILNLHNTTPLWKDTTFNIDLRYYDAQGVHPNEDGGELMYWYTKSQLEKFLKPQMTSMSDANMIGIRNKQMYVFDSSGYKIGAWKPYRMVGFTFNDSDSTVTPSGGGSSGDVTGPGSSTDNAAAVFNGATGKIIKNSTIIISPTGAITGIASMATSNVSLTPYNSGGVLDALKIINNNLGAVLGVQNNNGGGFSGIEYIGNDGLVKVFTGFANGITGQFRFNNIASSGNFVWMIASNSALAINNQRESLFDGLPDQGAFAVQAATGIFTSSLRINGPFNLNGFNGSAGQVLTSNGSSVPTWTSLAITTSGNTVPTGTAGTNVDAVTPYKVHWIRTNDEVSFSGTVDIDATVGSGSAVIELSLPGGLISDFAATTDASGVVSQGTAPNGTSGWVNASVANNRLVLTVTAVSTSAATYYFTGHFSIILP